MLTNEELMTLVNRLDTITIAIHQVDVAHISLVGYPRDIFALDTYLTERKAVETEPYLPLW